MVHRMENLKPCPFCGSECETHKSGNMLIGGCSNDDCKIRPMWIIEAERAPDNISVLLWEPVEIAFAAAWNRRT